MILAICPDSESSEVNFNLQAQSSGPPAHGRPCSPCLLSIARPDMYLDCFLTVKGGCFTFRMRELCGRILLSAGPCFIQTWMLESLAQGRSPHSQWFRQATDQFHRCTCTFHQLGSRG